MIYQHYSTYTVLVAVVDQKGHLKSYQLSCPSSSTVNTPNRPKNQLIPNFGLLARWSNAWWPKSTANEIGCVFGHCLFPHYCWWLGRLQIFDPATLLEPSEEEAMNPKVSSRWYWFGLGFPVKWTYVDIKHSVSKRKHTGGRGHRGALL